MVTEGEKTEESYFSIVKDYIPSEARIAISCTPSKGSAIKDILKTVKTVTARNTSSQDEVWVIVDRDAESHTIEQFKKLITWQKGSKRHFIAVSNPRFEYWLLCHFEDSPTKDGSMSDEYVARYLPGYNYRKTLDQHRSRITLQSIRHAIRTASLHPLASIDSATPGSDVWKLVQHLIPVLE
ncbi:MAG: RloB family protein [Akkermansia sp.]